MPGRHPFDFRPSVILAAALVLAACGRGGAPVSGGDANEMVFYRGNAAEPETLDPHLSGGIWESNIIGDMLIGLTTEGPSGEAIPGAASSWEVADDGLSWTFHLREHVWSDGTPVTAEDFAFAFRRILDPATASTYAYYLYPILNAEDVNAGQMPTDQLGVEAEDDLTLIVHLENPAPYLAQFMTHHTVSPVPRHIVEEVGRAWTRPGNYLSNGPYLLTEWVPNDQITTVRNPLFYDAENVVIDRVVWYPTADYSAAVQRLRAGEIDMQSVMPEVQIEWIRQNIPETIDLQPTLTVEYVSVNLTRPGLDDVRVREALNLGLDRETITEQVRRMGNPPAYSMVPPSIANYPADARLRFVDMPYPERVERARALMREAGYGPDNPLRVGLAVRSASAEQRRRPAAMQQMWREIYVDLEIQQSDAAVFYNLMQEHDYELGAAGWVADYNDASNFLDLLKTGTSNNYGQYSNVEFDALVDRAAAEQDLEVRGRLMAQAEQIALDDHAWIPVFFGVNRRMVRPYIEGWVTNVNDNMRTRWLSIDEEARAEMFPNRYVAR